MKFNKNINNYREKIINGEQMVGLTNRRLTFVWLTVGWLTFGMVDSWLVDFWYG